MSVLQAIPKADEAYWNGVVALTGGPSKKGGMVEQHLALLQGGVRHEAVLAKLHAAEAHVRWDALRLPFLYMQKLCI